MRLNVALLLAAVLAFALRAAPLMRANGAFGTADYDEGVYVGASALLTRGFMPYRDFGLLHPPGIALLLAPVVWIGHAIGGYAAAFAASRWLVCVVGGVNTYFVGRIARRWVGVNAAIAIALLYATFFNAVLNEGRVELEPFLNLVCLVAAFVWLANDEPTRRRAVAAGALVGAAASIKLYGFIYLVPMLVTAAGPHAWSLRRRLAGAALGVFAVVVGPFVAIGGYRHTWNSIVIAQISRPRGGDTLGGDVQGWARRLAQSFALGPLGGRSLSGAVGIALGLVMAGLCVLAWVRGGRHGRFWVIILVLGLVVFLRSPSFFETYPVFLAPATIALVVFGAREAIAVTAPRRVLAVVAAVMLVLSIGYALRVHAKNRYLDEAGLSDVGGRITPALTDTKCTYSDPSFYALAADRLPDPHGGVIDSFGDPFISAAEHGEHYDSPDAARLGSSYQARLRAAIGACDSVVLNADPAGRADWTQDTREWFSAHYRQVLPVESDQQPGVYVAILPSN